MPPRIETWLLPETEIGKGPSVESATTSALIVEVTVEEPATTVAVLAPLMIEMEPEETEVMVGFDDRITVGLDDRVTVPLLIESALLIANDGAEDSEMVPDETVTGTALWLLAMVTGAELAIVAWPLGLTLFGEIATTKAGSVDDGAVKDPTTAAVFAPLTIETAPDVIDAIVTPLDRITVGLDESVTVPDEIASALLIANDGAEDSVTVLVTAVESATVATEESATVLLVKVTCTADEGITVGLEESVTVGTPVIATLTFDDGVIERTDDGVTVPEETAMAVPARMSPIDTRWRWTPPPWSMVSTIVADEGVAGRELWKGTLLAIAG